MIPTRDERRPRSRRSGGFRRSVARVATGLLGALAMAVVVLGTAVGLGERRARTLWARARAA